MTANVLCIPPYDLVIEKLALICRVGVHAHEQNGPQQLLVDLRVQVRPRATPIDDRLDHVVCYEDIVGCVRAVAGSQHHALLETLAQRVIAACAEDSAVLAITLWMRKPGVLAEGGTVGVALTWSRETTP